MKLTDIKQKTNGPRGVSQIKKSGESVMQTGQQIEEAQRRVCSALLELAEPP